jgi:hypothetical protein
MILLLFKCGLDCSPQVQLNHLKSKSKKANVNNCRDDLSCTVRAAKFSQSYLASFCTTKSPKVFESIFANRHHQTIQSRTQPAARLRSNTSESIQQPSPQLRVLEHFSTAKDVPRFEASYMSDNRSPASHARGDWLKPWIVRDHGLRKLGSGERFDCAKGDLRHGEGRNKLPRLMPDI